MRPDRRSAPTGEPLPWRRTDRIEDAVAWLLTAAALILVVAAGVTGLAVHHQQVERAVAESAQRWQTSAVLLEDAVGLTGPNGERLRVQVPARWTDRAGTEHTDLIDAGMSAITGSVVEVWLDDEGRVVGRPVQPSTAVLVGVGWGAAVLVVGSALLFALWYAAWSLIAAANDRRWEREWARVEPGWRGLHFR